MDVFCGSCWAQAVELLLITKLSCSAVGMLPVLQLGKLRQGASIVWKLGIGLPNDWNHRLLTVTSVCSSFHAEVLLTYISRSLSQRNNTYFESKEQWHPAEDPINTWHSSSSGRALDRQSNERGKSKQKLDGDRGKMILVGCCFPPKLDYNSGRLNWGKPI